MSVSFITVADSLMCFLVPVLIVSATLQCTLYKVVQIAFILQYRRPIPAYICTCFANMEKYWIPIPISRYFEIPIPTIEPTLKNTKKIPKNRYWPQIPTLTHDYCGGIIIAGQCYPWKYEPQCASTLKIVTTVSITELHPLRSQGPICPSNGVR